MCRLCVYRLCVYPETALPCFQEYKKKERNRFFTNTNTQLKATREDGTLRPAARAGGGHGHTGELASHRGEHVVVLVVAQLSPISARMTVNGW